MWWEHGIVAKNDENEIKIRSTYKFSENCEHTNWKMTTDFLLSGIREKESVCVGK